MKKRKPEFPLHILQIVGDPRGGIRKHVHSILTGLDDTRFIQSYAYSDITTDTIFIKEIEDLYTQLQRIIPLHIEKKPKFIDLSNLMILMRYVKGANVDVVHGHGAKGGFYARIIGIFCQIPAIYTPHGGVVHRMFGFWEDKLYTFIERCLIRSTSCYVFVSHYSEESFLSRIGRISGQSLVNYNGIESPSSDASNRMDDRDKTHIGVFGILRQEKGQIHLINAVASIKQSGYEDVILHVFGEGPDREMLEKQVKKFCITETVIFYGDVSKPEQWMARMDIIAIPSLYESFGYVGIEAMALGKPVIASAVGGLCEVFNHETALLIPPRDETALRRAIIWCIHFPKKADAMAKEGMPLQTQKFSLDRMIKTISDCYVSHIFNYRFRNLKRKNHN